MVGCNYENFWYEDSKVFFQYIKAYNLRQESERNIWNSRADVLSWLNGYYVSHAISACFSNNSPYPKSPEMMLSKASESVRNGEKASNPMTEQATQEEAIKQRSAEIKKMLKSKNKDGPPKVMIGEKRR